MSIGTVPIDTFSERTDVLKEFYYETWVQAEEVSAQIDRENFASLCIVRSLGFVEMKGDGQCLEFRKTLAGDKTDPESPEAGALWEKILSAAGKQFRR